MASEERLGVPPSILNMWTIGGKGSINIPNIDPRHVDDQASPETLSI